MQYPTYYLPDADDYVLFDENSDEVLGQGPEVPLDSEYWICTCGHRNEGTERCEDCGDDLHEREWYWEDIPDVP